MSKKLPRILLIPAISLLPLAQNVIAQQTNASTPPPPIENSHPRDMVVRGKMLDAQTIQVSQQDLKKSMQDNKSRIITLTDPQGNKQRYTLVPPNRSQMVRELTAHNGQIKEFDLLKVVDDKGNESPLLAAKRTVSAPANQLTLQFKSHDDANGFLSDDRKKALAKESLTPAPLKGATATPQTTPSSGVVESPFNEGGKSGLPSHPMTAATFTAPPYRPPINVPTMQEMESTIAHEQTTPPAPPESAAQQAADAATYNEWTHLSAH